MIFNVELFENLINIVDNIKCENLKNHIKKSLEFYYNINDNFIDTLNLYNDVYDKLNAYKDKNIPNNINVYLNSLINALHGNVYKVEKINEKYIDDFIKFINNIGFINFDNLSFNIFLGINKKYITIFNNFPEDEINKVKENPELKCKLLEGDNIIYYIELK